MTARLGYRNISTFSPIAHQLRPDPWQPKWITLFSEGNDLGVPALAQVETIQDQEQEREDARMLVCDGLKGLRPWITRDPPTPVNPAGVFAGVDLDHAHQQLSLVDEAGQVVHQRRYAHSADGLERLDRHLRRHASLTGIAIERGEGPLVDRLQAAGRTVYCVSPKISARAGTSPNAPAVPARASRLSSATTASSSTVCESRRTASSSSP
ncbi:hypothetical protein [Streptomyces sp. NPDC057580]|uniref:hypothetical protein n=1 Tax=Streptomyces sp. NPDC057580 TaxID=3346173 RepID=UPI003689AE9C